MIHYEQRFVLLGTIRTKRINKSFVKFKHSKKKNDRSGNDLKTNEKKLDMVNK